MLSGNADEWPVAGGGAGEARCGGAILMKLQNGLIDLSGCMLQLQMMRLD